ncbi:hypothetical protein CR513_30486, partial [Mucuna pruriens]
MDISRTNSHNLGRKSEPFLLESFTFVEHPKSNGQAEAVNKVILRGLRKRLEEAKGRWVEELPQKGDLVMRRILTGAAMNKLTPNWEGPFRVREQIRQGAFRTLRPVRSNQPMTAGGTKTRERQLVHDCLGHQDP